MNIQDEKANLLKISQESLYAAGLNTATILYSFEILKRYLHGDRVLELGPAEGVMTAHLVETGKQITAVEGSELFCEDLQGRFSGLKVIHCLFEEFVPREAYDFIVLGHVLEHVENPVQILSLAKQWLAPGGQIFAAVPNANSVHRQAAVLMKLLPHEDSLNEMDIYHGHRRVFRPESFKEAFKQAGLQIDFFGGYWMKPLSNAQMEKDWTPEMISAFMKLGEKYPDIAGEIYVLASNPS